jgi:hypothetical protein
MNKAWQWIIAKQRQTWWEYSFLVLLIMLPLLAPGYIFALDMVFAPKLPLPLEVSSSFLFNAALHYLNYILPSQAIQKLMLFGTLLIAGVGAHRLTEGIGDRVKSAAKHLSNPKPSTLNPRALGAYFAGLLFMINPFTYVRFMDGHYAVLMGYALLPWFVRAVFKFFDQPQIRAAIRLTGLAVLISIVSLHTIGMAALLASAAGLVFGWRNRRNQSALRRAVKWGAAMVLGGIVLSSYWLVPMLQGQTSQTQLIGNFDERHLLSFRTDGDDRFGVPFNVAALYGYWGDREDRYIVPKEQVVIWPVLAVAIWLLAALGLAVSWRKPAAIILGLTGLAALVLAIGIAWPPVAGLNRWLYAHLPFMRGYREPQKWVALVALALAYFGAKGVGVIIEGIGYRVKGSPVGTKIEATSPMLSRSGNWKIKIGSLLTLVLLLLPILYTPTMLWGFNGQLRPQNYPGDWYAVNARLNEDQDQFRVLFLPWHQYMSFEFAGRVIANPAPRFFDKPIIAGDNAEIGLIERQVSNLASEYVEAEVLDRSANMKHAGERLAKLNIKYVLLAKEYDWQEYDWLNSQADLRLEAQTANLRLYRNIKYQVQP